MGDCVKTAMQEKEKQEKNALTIRIGGLPQVWDDNDEEFEASLITLGKYLTPIHIDTKDVKELANKKDYPLKRFPSGHAIMTLDTKEARTKILKQSQLLKGSKIWIAEELTMEQLKSKGEELKKIREARALGKWAVYRGGKAIIQDFRTPKPQTSSVNT